MASDYTNLNQGSYGSTPKYVLQAQRPIQEVIEGNPNVWFRTNITGDGASPFYSKQTAARKALARFVGAGDEDLVFVDSTSRGASTPC